MTDISITLSELYVYGGFAISGQQEEGLSQLPGAFTLLCKEDGLFARFLSITTVEQ